MTARHFDECVHVAPGGKLPGPAGGRRGMPAALPVPAPPRFPRLREQRRQSASARGAEGAPHAGTQG